MKKKKVFFDLGHGGTDPGAVSNGLQEKNIVLEIGKRINELMKQYEGVEWKFSRLDDRTLSLTQRTNMANAWGADLLVSIHINAGGGEGFESYIYNKDFPGKAGTVAMQNVVHNAIMKRVKGFFGDRGKKQANLHMCRESKMKAILTENGFIDNVQDAAKLKKGEVLDAIALGHVEGVAEFLGLKKTQTQTQTKSNGDKLYRVQVGAFANRENAERLVKELKAKGYTAFVKSD